MTKILLLGYGNPGRGDDALGPALVEHFQQSKQPKQSKSSQTCFQSDVQLVVEHVTDLKGYDPIVFVDADASCDEPFYFSAIHAQKDESYTSHALTPSALLYVYQQVYQSDAPTAFLLRIRGYNFALGDHLSNQATSNLNAAIQFISQRYRTS